MGITLAEAIFTNIDQPLVGTDQHTTFHHCFLGADMADGEVTMVDTAATTTMAAMEAMVVGVAITAAMAATTVGTVGIKNNL
jgi:hypothetical protein